MKKFKKTFIHIPKYGCYINLDDIVRLGKDCNGSYLLLNTTGKYRIDDDYYKKIEELFRNNNNIIDL